MTQSDINDKWGSRKGRGFTGPKSFSKGLDWFNSENRPWVFDPFKQRSGSEYHAPRGIDASELIDMTLMALPAAMGTKAVKGAQAVKASTKPLKSGTEAYRASQSKVKNKSKALQRKLAQAEKKERKELDKTPATKDSPSTASRRKYLNSDKKKIDPPTKPAAAPKAPTNNKQPKPHKSFMDHKRQAR